MGSFLRKDFLYKNGISLFTFSFPLVITFFHKFSLFFLPVFFSFQLKTFPSFLKRTFPPKLTLEIVFFFYAGLSIFWSLDPWSSFLKWSQIGLLSFLGMALLQSSVYPSEKSLLYGWAGALGLLLFELMTQGPIYRWLHHVPSFLSMSVFNKGLTGLAFLFWPWLGLLARGKPFWVYGGVLLLFTALCALSHSETTTVAMVFSSLAFFLGKIFPTSLGPLIRIGMGMAGGFLFLFPFYADEIQALPLLQHLPTLKHRFLIWEFFIQLAQEKPLAGWGLQSAHFFAHDQVYVKNYQLSAFHTHHVPLQIWMELGVVGLCLAFLGCHKILRTIEKQENLPLIEKNLLLSQFVMIFIISNAAFGAWQTWWIALLWIGIFYNKVLLSPKKLS